MACFFFFHGIASSCTQVGQWGFLGILSHLTLLKNMVTAAVNE